MDGMPRFIPKSERLILALALPPQRSFAVAVAGLHLKRSTVIATGFAPPTAVSEVRSPVTPVIRVQAPPEPETVEEEEEMAGQQVLAEAFLNQTRKAVETLAEVGRSRTEENSDGRGEQDHEVASWFGVL